MTSNPHTVHIGTLPPTPPSSDDETSLLDLGASLVKGWKAITLCVIVGGGIAAISTLGGKPTYTAAASFMPEGSDANRGAGLRSIAGQFGVSVDAAVGGVSQPQLYNDLLHSHIILGNVAQETVTVRNRRATIAEHLGLSGQDSAGRVENAYRALNGMLQTGPGQRTPVVSVNVTATDPQLALAITRQLLDEVNRFNLETRQTQATGERAFTEARLRDARASLAASEERLKSFLQSNRQYQGDPQLQFERERLARDVALQQQIVASLSGAYEDVRIREIRNLPVITILERPWVSQFPNPRGRLRRGLFGVLAGLVVGILFIVTRDTLRRRLAEGDPGAERLVSALERLKPGRARARVSASP